MRQHSAKDAYNDASQDVERPMNANVNPRQAVQYGKQEIPDSPLATVIENDH